MALTFFKLSLVGRGDLLASVRSWGRVEATLLHPLRTRNDKEPRFVTGADVRSFGSIWRDRKPFFFFFQRRDEAWINVAWKWSAVDMADAAASPFTPLLSPFSLLFLTSAPPPVSAFLSSSCHDSTRDGNGEPPPPQPPPLCCQCGRCWQEVRPSPSQSCPYFCVERFWSPQRSPPIQSSPDNTLQRASSATRETNSRLKPFKRASQLRHGQQTGDRTAHWRLNEYHQWKVTRLNPGVSPRGWTDRTVRTGSLQTNADSVAGFWTRTQTGAERNLDFCDLISRTKSPADSLLCD